MSPIILCFFVALLRIGNEINIGYAAKNERNSSSYIEIQWYIYHCGYVYRVVRQGFFSCNSAPFAESGCEIRTFPALVFYWAEADYRPNATLYRVKEAKSFYPFSSIPYDPYKSSMALFLSEFLYRAIREEAENRPLFAYLQHSIIWLDECGDGFANFHLVFLMRL